MFLLSFSSVEGRPAVGRPTDWKGFMETTSDQSKDRFGELRSEIDGLLKERGVSMTDPLIASFEDEDLAGVVATIRYWDDQKPHTGPGLLVHMIRSGEHTGYKRREDRGKAPAGTITPALERAIRGSCGSPNGFTRDEARDMFGAKAKHLGMSADSLIDHVMGSEWRETPPHAAFDRSLPTEMRQRAYERLLGGRGGAKPGSAGAGERGQDGAGESQARPESRDDLPF